MTRPNAVADQSSHYSRLDNIPTMPLIGEGIAKPIPAPTDELDPETRKKIEQARDQQRAIREQAIKRYQVASMAYIGAMVRKRDDVSAVWERIVDKWLEGKLSSYQAVSDSGEPQKFRIFLKTVLRNEVYAFSRERARDAQRGPVRLPSEYDAVDTLEATASEAFDRGIQDTIISRALEAVRVEDTLYYETLRLLMNSAASDSKSVRSKELAECLTRLSEKRISEDNARKIKERSKLMLSRKIIEQVGLFIEDNDLDRIEDALKDWDLIRYCKKTIDEMRRKGSSQ
jgi:hypothetical protein